MRIILTEKLFCAHARHLLEALIGPVHSTEHGIEVKNTGEGSLHCQLVNALEPLEFTITLPGIPSQQKFRNFI